MAKKKKNTIKGTDYLDKKQSEDYEQKLKEADPNYKQEEKIDSIFAVDEKHEVETEEQTFMDKVFNVWDAYTD